MKMDSLRSYFVLMKRVGASDPLLSEDLPPAVRVNGEIRRLVPQRAPAMVSATAAPTESAEPEPKGAP